MKPLTLAIITALGILGGWFGHAYLLPQTAELEAQIVANEDVCDEDVPAGYASYPVTRFGELRGCLRVKVDVPEWMPSRSIFVRRAAK